jgi:hypothetical protein
LESGKNGWGTFKDGKFTSSEKNEKIIEAFEWLVTNICDEAIGALNADKTFNENLSLLNKAYAYDRLKPLNQRKNILDNVDFPVNEDLNQIFMWIDKQFSLLEACGG